MEFTHKVNELLNLVLSNEGLVDLVTYLANLMIIPIYYYYILKFISQSCDVIIKNQWSAG